MFMLEIPEAISESTCWSKEESLPSHYHTMVWGFETSRAGA